MDFFYFKLDSKIFKQTFKWNNIAFVKLLSYDELVSFKIIMSFIQDSLARLRAADYKITGPRQAVLEVLQRAAIPLSAYDIEERIPENIPINVVTIYRVLELFEKLGITHRIHTKEGFVRCDFEQKKGCHTFAVCDTCGRADEFIEEKCEMEIMVPKNLPYRSLKHLSEMAGTCDNCSASESRIKN